MMNSKNKNINNVPVEKNCAPSNKDFWQSLPITDDYIFGKVFEDADLCKEMLDILLNIKIDRIEYLNLQKSMKGTYFAKGIRLDVYAENESQAFDVEIQTVNQYNISLRSRYYHSCIDVNLINAGDFYENLKECYVIFLCTFDPIGKRREFR